MTTSDDLRRMGFPPDLVARATVNGRPVDAAPREPEHAWPKLNKTESRYAAALEARKLGGEIRDWKAQSLTFRLAYRTSYTPDFVVTLIDGSVLCVEVKGFLRDDAAVKYKLARQLFPAFQWRMVRWEKNQWMPVAI